jgi:DNA-binding XRE family transcriptional regulator
VLSRTYFTESGYLMLVKSLTDDLSWEVQRLLVNSYFRANLLDQVLAFLPRQVRMLVHYRSLGLTQRETARLLSVSRDSVKSLEKRLKSLGYAAPNLSGQRTAFIARSEQLELPL